jgi:hypothetical protein
MYGPAPQLNPGLRLAQPGLAKREDANRWSSHGQNLYNSLTRKDGAEGELTVHWLYFIFKVLALIATIFLLVVLLMVTFTTVFQDSTDSAVYVTNTFYTTNDKESNVSWQVLTSSNWNNMPRAGVGAYGTVAFEHFYECMWVARIGYQTCNASAATVATYTTCLQSSFSTQLSSCATYGDPLYWPTANQYSGCVNDKLNNGQVWSLNAFRTCVDVNPWPIYEVPQDVTTIFFLGSYSWPLLVIVSTFLFFVFALYTIWPVDWEDATIVEHGKPESSFVRLGMLWSGLAALFAGVILIIVLIISFRAGDSTWPNNNTNLYPSTQQTNVAMVVSTLTVLFYFLFDASEFQERNANRSGYERIQRDKDMDNQHGQNDRDGWEASRIPIPVSMGLQIPLQAKPHQLGYMFPEQGTDYSVNSAEKLGRTYAPVLLKTWSDAYLLDPLFAVGVIGATMQVFTADVYNIFWCLMFYRIAHAGAARAVYYAYMRVHYDTDSGKSPESIAATKVLALGIHFAGIFALIVPIYIVFDNTRMISDYQIIVSMIILSYFIPEALRVLGHLFLSMQKYEPGKHQGLYILLVVQFIWAWDLVVRCVFIWILLWGNAGTRGTKPYLISGLNSINTILQLA